GRRYVELPGDLAQRGEDPLAAGVEVFLQHALAARPLQIRAGLIFARQEPACEREEAYGAEALRLNDGQKRVLEIRASVKVVGGLHDLIAWQALCPGYCERLAQAVCLEIGGADG